MSLEAIQKVTQVDRESQERKAAAASEARELTAGAEREGQALLHRMRAEAAEAGRDRLRQAEERAAARAGEIEAEARAEGETLRRTAEQRLEKAAEFIVERVVKQ